MTAENLQNLLEHPYRIAESELEALEELVTQFPYFQLGHLLIAKYAHDQESMLAPQKIRRAAIHAQDRRLLRRLIMLLPPTEETSNGKTQTENLGQELKNSKSFFDLLPTIELDEAAEGYKPKENVNRVHIKELLKEPIETIWENQISEVDAIELFNAGKIEEAKTMYENLGKQNPDLAQMYQERWAKLSSNLPNLSEETEEIVKDTVLETVEIAETVEISEPVTENTDAFFEDIVPAGQPDYIHFNEGLALGLYYDGKEKEAMDMYKKLMEFYPEKRDYYRDEVIMLVGKKTYKSYFDDFIQSEPQNSPAQETAVIENFKDTVVFDIEASKNLPEEMPQISLQIEETGNQNTVNSFFEDIESESENTNTFESPPTTYLSEEEKPYFDNIESLTFPESIADLPPLEIPAPEEAHALPTAIDAEAIFLTENQAIAFFNQGKLDLAVDIYEQLIKQNPIKTAYYESQIRVLRETIRETLRPAKKVETQTQSDENEEPSEDLAIRLFMQEKTAEAIGVYEKLIELNPNKRTYFLRQIEVLKS